MAILTEKDKAAVRERLSEMVSPVKMIVFAPATSLIAPGRRECAFCTELRELMGELAELNDKLQVEFVDPYTDPVRAAAYDLKKDGQGYLVPAIVLTGLQNGEEVDYGIRFYGIPAGYEFATLLEDILMISTGHHHLAPQVLDEVSRIDKPVDIMVFVTPTCPYCPRAVLTAHQFAFVNPNIRGSMIEAMEFEQLSQDWNVYGVPKTVINEVVEFEGAMPDNMVLRYLENALVKA
ncbi:Alkyl hydroperoxide reductase subunit F [bacterium HR16]|nr:Alkyl hydroperoxide reductase subunit F [bacterium HR16]